MGSGTLKRAWHLLISLKLAVILLFAILLVAFLSTLFPQLPPDVAADPETRSLWLAMAQEKYGLLFGPLHALGLFEFSEMWWFRLLLAALFLNTLACTVNRLGSIWRIVFRPQVRPSSVVFERGVNRISLRGDSSEKVIEAVKGALSKRRYRLSVRREGETTYLLADKNRLARLGSLFTHISLLIFILGALWCRGFGWRREVALTPGETYEIRSGVGLRSEGFEVERYPGGEPRDYRAHLAVIEGGKEVLTKIVRVNEPLVYGGVSLYLKSYEPLGAEVSSDYEIVFLAVHDPSFVPVIFAGFFMLGGLILSFYFPHYRIWAKVTGEGDLSLVGRGYVDQEGLASQFEAIVRELRKGFHV
jgi:cytochrome c biogenesis protein